MLRCSAFVAPSCWYIRVTGAHSCRHASLLSVRSGSYFANGTSRIVRRSSLCKTDRVYCTLSSVDAPSSNRDALYTEVRDAATTPEVVTRMQAATKILGDDKETLVNLVRSAFPYELDDFQISALYALAGGRSVVLSAPTGAGKTVVGEMAVYLAMVRRGPSARVFYCTPLKALSNQKFYDFQRLFGAENVGLLTGDVTVNRDASVVGTFVNLCALASRTTSTDKP